MTISKSFYKFVVVVVVVVITNLRTIKKHFKKPETIKKMFNDFFLIAQRKKNVS